MAKKPTAAPASARLTRTFALARPVRSDGGGVWAELTLAEPELRHEAAVDRKKTAGRNARLITLIAALSGVPEDAVERLKARDALAMEAWIEELRASAVQADALSDAAAGVTDLAAAEERTFELLAPIETSDKPLTSITVREPDLAAGVSIERMSTEAERTAALIAATSGLVIPVVMRMSMRDVARINRWYDGFFTAGANSPKPPAAAEVRAMPDGAMLPPGSPVT